MQALERPSPELRPSTWFSIVGAPRCGTTSLVHYLSGHHDICFSKPKEPHFFSRYLIPDGAEQLAFERAEALYLDRFYRHRTHEPVLADGSVSYLYAPERLLPALKIWPDARFIVAVRNPLEMLPSLHLRNLYNGDESVRSFERAWGLVEERRQGRKVPRSCSDSRLLDYKEIGQLGKHVRRFFEIVGRERCYVSVFDDLATHPQDQVRSILEFLNLSIDLPIQFEVHRPTRHVKILWLQRLLKRPPGPVRELLASDANMVREGSAIHSRSRTGRVGQFVMQSRMRVLRWNRSSKPVKEPRADVRREMCDFFHDDVLELSALLGRDLRHWLSH
jgi:sulfotransferase family protein